MVFRTGFYVWLICASSLEFLRWANYGLIIKWLGRQKDSWALKCDSQHRGCPKRSGCTGIWGPEAGLEFSRMRLTFELNTNFCGLGHVCIVLEALALTCGFWRVWENLVHMEISALIPVGEEFPVHPAPCVPVREGVRMCTALMTMASHFIFLICSLWLFTIRSVVIFPNTAYGKVLQTIKLYFCWKNTCQ